MTRRAPVRFITVSVADGPAAIVVRVAAGVRWRDALPQIKRLAQDAAGKRLLWRNVFVFEGPWDNFFMTYPDSLARAKMDEEWNVWKWRNGYVSTETPPGPPLSFPLYEINLGGVMRLSPGGRC